MLLEIGKNFGISITNVVVVSLPRKSSKVLILVKCILECYPQNQRHRFLGLFYFHGLFTFKIFLLKNFVIENKFEKLILNNGSQPRIKYQFHKNCRIYKNKNSKKIKLVFEPYFFRMDFVKSSVLKCVIRSDALMSS